MQNNEGPDSIREESAEEMVPSKTEPGWISGQRLLNDRFELEERLGAGAMGVVYRASDLETARLQDSTSRIALKLFSAKVRSFPNAELILQREINRARVLTHANIIRLYEFYKDRDTWLVTMEFLQGHSWDHLLREQTGSGMSFEKAAPLIQQFFDALSHAHSRHIVHSNLKPQNVFLTDERVVKILDFGSAAPWLGALSPAYASLEMWQGLEVDRRDDIYSAACIVYQLLSGRHPFNHVTAVEAIQSRFEVPIKGLTDSQNNALQHALRLRRSDRTPTIRQFSQELFASGRSSSHRRYRKGLGWSAGALAVVGSYMLGRALLEAPRRTGAPEAVVRAVPGSQAIQLAQFLGAEPDPFRADKTYSREQVMSALESVPRRVTLGSSPTEIDRALSLCQLRTSHCERSWYSDENYRTVLLTPFLLDEHPVTVRSFGEFVTVTGYRTAAERRGGVYTFLNGRLQGLPGATWRSTPTGGSVDPGSPVVAVDFDDARAFCKWEHLRLPTENEWEYIARGPQRLVFPWGNEWTLTDAEWPAQSLPNADAGPPEGIGGNYRSLSGNVWQWVDTRVRDRQALKGGSWLEQNPANIRAAVRRLELPIRADMDTGFRCARSASKWPDMSVWMRRL